ncbi:Uma2 family endonuclease [Synechococcus sp. PCC 7336]|uniref:Uma2 family endonuclease n=1 Tax=Synechococcus sp. PCC 7336 TaxID=195250 RepID=UPI000348D0E8|nr:Uma2 family endonuclease [Synechococcus sp. PCC 7336]
MIAIARPHTEPVYPVRDDEPLAESYAHLYAILTILEALRQHVSGRRATVLANQFLYYAQGFPKLRVAPDVMVIFDVEPGGRDCYKVWEESKAPTVIFEITSASTSKQDFESKKHLYESLEVQEYWLFDPKGDWIEGQLLGYQLVGDDYAPITDKRSERLQLRLEVEGDRLSFYREDTGEKLLVSDELVLALQEATAAKVETQQQLEATQQALEQELQQRAETEALLDRYRQQFGDLPEE